MSEVPKQYMMLLDEPGMNLMSLMFKNVQFIEVTGMDIKDNPHFKIIGTPVKETPKVEDAPV